MPWPTYGEFSICADYLVVTAYAVAGHGIPRAAGDISWRTSARQGADVRPEPDDLGSRAEGLVHGPGHRHTPAGHRQAFPGPDIHDPNQSAPAGQARRGHDGRPGRQRLVATLPGYPADRL
jgi:hypothetical protein